MSHFSGSEIGVEHKFFAQLMEMIIKDRYQDVVVTVKCNTRSLSDALL